MSVQHIVPQVIRHASSSFADGVARLSDTISKERSALSGLAASKVTTQSYRSSAIESIPSIELCLLPDIGGKHRDEVRPLVSTEALPLVTEIMTSNTKQDRKKCIVFQGRCNGQYLRRIQLAEDAHVVVVEKETEAILRHIEGCGFADDASAIRNFTFIRGNLMFLLHHLIRSSSVDNIVLASPKPYPSVSQSHSRSVHRDFFLMGHKALKSRYDESDSRGFLAWTDHKPFWTFMHEQMDETKLLVPFAKKKPSVMERLLPLQSDISQPIARLHYFAAHKKSTTPSAVDGIIDTYSYGRQYHRALFDGSTSSHQSHQEGRGRETRAVISAGSVRSSPPSSSGNPKPLSTSTKGAW